MQPCASSGTSRSQPRAEMSARYGAENAGARLARAAGLFRVPPRPDPRPRRSSAVLARSRTLVAVLPDYPPTPTPVSLLYPAIGNFHHAPACSSTGSSGCLPAAKADAPGSQDRRTGKVCERRIPAVPTFVRAPLRVKLKRIGPTGATGSTSNNGNLYGRAGAITGVPIGVMARQRATCPGIPWNIPPPCGSISRAQRVSLTTRRDAAAATRAIALASTACGQRPCGKWNSGLLPTSVT
jgi:hypothetical protein